MWKQIVRFFEIPFDPLDEKSNQIQIVGSLINMGILILLIFVIYGFIERGLFAPQVYIAIGMIFILIGSRVAIIRLKTGRVSILLVYVLWLCLNIICLFFENGLRAPIYTAGMIFLVVYVGLLHGKRALITVAMLSVITGVTIAIMEWNGIYLTEPKIPDITWTIVILLVLLPATAYMVTRTLDNLKKSISLYREEAEKRRQSEQEVMKLNRGLKEAYETTLLGWSRALELRDKETEGHSRRVSELTRTLAIKLNFDEDEIRYAYYGALLHDIGKMGIPDEILRKNGKLTPEEREIINQHPSYAYNMLKDIEYLRAAISIPYSHHENWDGTGYPQGLKGETIPLPARIFAIVDNWDALTSDRPYRIAWPRKKVIHYIEEQSGKKFDPQIVELFLDVINGK